MDTAYADVGEAGRDLLPDIETIHEVVL